MCQNLKAISINEEIIYFTVDYIHFNLLLYSDPKSADTKATFLQSF